MRPLRLAMWSGPRNISTAMMRAWENRGDCAVVDEPLYAHYLAHTGLEHPGREEIIAAGETDWRKVAAGLTGPVPDGKPIFYQKHMTHHLLPHIGRAWLGELTHVFLIRDPRAVLVSYTRTRREVTAEDLGSVQELEIFQHLREADRPHAAGDRCRRVSQVARSAAAAVCARSSASASRRACCSGRPARAPPMVSGRRTGMREF